MKNNSEIVNAWLKKAKHDIGIAKLAIDDGCVFARSNTPNNSLGQSNS